MNKLQRIIRRGLLAAAAIAALAAPAAAVTATAAPASAAMGVPRVVLVNQPPTRVVVGHTFPVGVWYQSYSGGSRHYHLAVYEPPRVGGHLIFYKAGTAPSSAWAIWNIRASVTGWYKIVYHAWYHGVWTRYVAYTVSVR
jgi:opacity protein-like surface antigen